VVERCLTKDPALRPTAVEVLDSLAAIGIASAPVLAAEWDWSDATSPIAGNTAPPTPTPTPTATSASTTNSDSDAAAATERIEARHLPATSRKGSRDVMPRRRLRGATATVVAGTVLTAGGIAWEEMGQPTGRTRPPSESRSTTRPEPSTAPTDVDEAAAEKACSLLTFAQIKQLTGIVVHSAAKQSRAVGDGSCFWATDDPGVGVFIGLTLAQGLPETLQCFPNDGKYAMLPIHGSSLPKECLGPVGASIFLSDGHDSAYIAVARDRVTQDATAGLAVAEAVRPKI
jgi:hypothetical protein